MRGLVLRDVIGALANVLDHLLCAHVLDDLGELVGEVGAHLQFVVVEIHGQAHQRAAEAILVGRVEIEIVGLVAVHRGVHARRGRDRAQIVVALRLLPFGAPARRAGRHRRRLDRPSIRLHLAEIAAADEAERAVIEIVAVELVDAHADRAGRDERVEVELGPIEEADHARHGLVGEVAADVARAGLRIVGLADPGEQQKLDVEQLKCAQEDEVGRLLPFLAGGVDEGDAGRALAAAVEVDARDLAFGARREVRLAHQRRQNRGLRARLRIVGAAEPFAEAAIGALPELDAERVGVGLRQVAGGLRKRLVAELARRLGIERVAEWLLLRRRRIGARARAFERIAAPLDISLEIAGGAGGAAHIFEPVVMRLDVLPGDAPVLDGHVVGQEFLAVALGEMRAQDEIGRQEAPGLGVPVDAGAADAVAEHKGAPVAHRQRGLARLVAERHRDLRRPQEQLVLDAVAQLVLRVGDRKRRRRVAPRAALERDDVKARLGKLVGEDRAGPSQADDHGISVRELACHRVRLDAISPAAADHCDQSGCVLMPTGGSVTRWLWRSTHSR